MPRCWPEADHEPELPFSKPPKEWREHETSIGANSASREFVTILQRKAVDNGMFERAAIVVFSAVLLNKSNFFIELPCRSVRFTDFEHNCRCAGGHGPAKQFPYQQRPDTPSSRRLVNYHAFDFPVIGQAERFVLVGGPVRGGCCLLLNLADARNVGGSGWADLHVVSVWAGRRARRRSVGCNSRRARRDRKFRPPAVCAGRCGRWHRRAEGSPRSHRPPLLATLQAW